MATLHESEPQGKSPKQVLIAEGMRLRLQGHDPAAVLAELKRTNRERGFPLDQIEVTLARNDAFYKLNERLWEALET